MFSKFMELLEKHGVVAEYEQYMMCDTIREDFDETVEIWEVDAVIGCFETWGNTDSGHEKWSDINQEWLLICKENG
jgi:hypothetical protein